MTTSTIEFKAKPPLRYRIPKCGRFALASLSVAAMVGTGATLAYLTDTENTTNKFTVVQALNIDLLEPNWTITNENKDEKDKNNNKIPDAAENLVPLQKVAKDPQIKNTAGTDAWVFMRVDVPTRTVKTIGSDGKTINAAADTELFTYAVNSGWEEIGKAAFNSETGYTSHYYAYKAIAAVGAKTAPLFEEVQLVNLADGQLNALAVNGVVSLDIPVTAYGIQSSGFKSYSDAWTAYKNQNSL